ncbi:MAG TPA: DUF5615 family PIN-like protein [Alphaproteobacteria bacterium]|nr:DUF5615 family PIN-like protein [Alphaproteobacteria bacterium]
MKFLVDAQLPPALARAISDAGHEARHVADVDLLMAADEHIWSFAREDGVVLITKDEDFAERWSQGDRNVPIVWIRIGNSSRHTLLRWFLPKLDQICAMIEQGETLIELR